MKIVKEYLISILMLTHLDLHNYVDILVRFVMLHLSTSLIHLLVPERIIINKKKEEKLRLSQSERDHSW